MNKPVKYIYEFGPFRLDTAEHLLLHRGRPVSLKPKLFDLLLLFVQNSGHMLTKDELMRGIWPNIAVEEHNLAVSIFGLRKTLGDILDEPLYIETIPRRGYRFIAAVKRIDHERGDPLTMQHSGSERVIDRTRELKSIVVLPLRFIGEDQGDEYLGMGMADALITKLSNLKQIAVRPTSAVRKHIGREQDPIAAGRELQAAAVLDGSIRRAGERLRVTVQLINVEHGTTLWAEKFDAEFTDIFAVEDSISEQVVKALTLKLTSEERERLAKRYTENTEAYRAYLKGRHFLNKRTAEGMKRSVDCFEHAIQIDPCYALAYAGLADSYFLLFQFGVLLSPDCLTKAKERVLRALELDKTLVEAHASMAHLRLMCDWDWSGAEKEYRYAIEINQNDAFAHQFYSVYLRHSGRFDEALTEIKKAQALDPVSLSINLGVATTHFFARDYEQAIQEVYKVLELDENYPPAYFVLGLAYEKKREYELAITAHRKANSILNNDNPEVAANIGRNYALLGQTSEAARSLEGLLQQSKLNYISPYYIALIYSGLEEEERAFAWLEKACAVRDCELCMLKVDPRLDNLHDDPRFRSLLERVGFTSMKSGPFYAELPQ